MKVYKTPEHMRQQALQYYYAHRAAVLEKMKVYRREQGILPRPAAKTDQEKLAAVVLCACGRRVKTPSLLRESSKRCLRCVRLRRQGPGGAALRSRQYRASLTNAIGKFWAWKNQQVCSKCGQVHTKQNPLDLHHLNPATKLFKVSRGLHRVSAVRLWAEIAKCEVLCRTCHKAKHDYS